MKFFIVLSALVAVNLCSPIDPKADIVLAELIARRRLPALEHEEVHDDFGQFALRFVTAEGTVVSERGRLVPTVDGDYVLITEGEITFVGDDGEIYTNKFTAGTDGYQVESNHPLIAPEPVVIPAIVERA
ncbi:uncharacterized protein LOC123692305 [Colias croceus]|uniref:uncharacterized protein LOC123692305 n=1 Tax=Colias crocea TaxID=72248 RepID=UPI001E28106C|nr:uncharacterized protein LOC123692305 [Colias croceus]